MSIPQGDFLFAVKDRKFYWDALHGEVMGDGEYNNWKNEANGSFEYIFNNTLWKIEYTVYDPLEREAFVILQIEELDDPAPLTIAESERMREVIRTADTLDKLLNWL